MRITFFSAPWGYPSQAVALNKGRYFDIRSDGWGGYVAEEIPRNALELKPNIGKMVRIPAQAGWREAVIKAMNPD